MKFIHARWFFIGCLLVMVSCKKFLGVTPSTTTINPLTVKDFREILNNDSLAMCDFVMADIMTDDVYLSEDAFTNGPSKYSRSYYWEKNIWNPGETDLSYNDIYKRIFQMNMILGRIDAAPVDSSNTLQQKNIVRAQALINRAWYYVQLANIYGSDYRAATATTDLTVPLVLRPDANALPARATVQEMYDQLIKDLTAAVNESDLPGMGVDILHPGKAAGFALLARVYLYMGDYTKALANANSCLSIHDNLMDYQNAMGQPTQLQDLINNPEILLARFCINTEFGGTYFKTFSIGGSLSNLFSYNDMRYRLNFYRDNYLSFGDFEQAFNYSLGVPEVMLIKAECLARTGDAAGAIALVNELAKNRISEYEPITDPGRMLCILY